MLTWRALVVEIMYGIANWCCLVAEWFSPQTADDFDGPPMTREHLCDYPRHPERCGWPGHRRA